jgi:exonuclease III
LKHDSEYQVLFNCIGASNDFKFDLLCFVETWLSTENSNLAHFDGYNHVMKLKTSTYRGGGLSIFVSNEREYKLRDDLVFANANTDEFDCLFVEVLSNNSKEQNTIVGLIYRSPSYNNEKEFIASLENLLVKLERERKETVILGDFNMDLIKAHLHHPTSELLDIFMNYYFAPQISLPTRVTQNTATLIDHMYKNNPDKNSIAGTLLTDITDHYMNFILINKEVKDDKYPDTVTYRPITESKIKKFNENLEKINWTHVLHSNDPNEAYDIYLNLYQTALDNAMPIKTVKLNESQET